MRILFLTTGDEVKGLESDDGFTIGQFTLSDTIGLVIVTAFLGIVAALLLLAARPFVVRFGALATPAMAIFYGIVGGALFGQARRRRLHSARAGLARDRIVRTDLRVVRCGRQPLRDQRGGGQLVGAAPIVVVAWSAVARAGVASHARGCSGRRGAAARRHRKPRVARHPRRRLGDDGLDLRARGREPRRRCDGTDPVT